MSKAAYEAIMFQSNSSLGKNISSALTKGFQYRNALDYSNIPEKEIIAYRKNKMREYCVTVFIPELQKIVKRDCGIIIDNVLLGNAPSGFFACDFGFDDEFTLYFMDRTTGFNQRNETIKQSADKLGKLLADNVDLETSRVNNRKNMYKMNLYFDYLLVFCLYDYVSPSLVDEFTPDEITAILLHEIGHLYTLAEHAADEYFKMRSLDDTLRNINKNLLNNNDNKEAFDIIKTKVLPALKKQKDIPEEIINVTYKIADKIDESLKYGKETSIIDNFVLRYLMFLYKVFYICLVASVSMYRFLFKKNIMGALLHFYKNLIIPVDFFKRRSIDFIDIAIFLQSPSKLFGEIYNHAIDYLPWVNPLLKNIKMNEKSKSGTVANTMYNVRSIEQRADEFATKHGYGSYLASGLTKIHDLVQYFATDPTMNYLGFNDKFRGSAIYVNALKLITTITSLLSIDNQSVSMNILDKQNIFNKQIQGYDKEVDRIKRTLVTCRSVFKEDLDPKSMSAWILEYERLQKALDDSKSRVRNSKISNFLKTVQQILVLGPSLFEQDLRKYEEFLTQVNELIDNEMYFNSAKFKQLASLK